MVMNASRVYLWNYRRVDKEVRCLIFIRGNRVVIVIQAVEVAAGKGRLHERVSSRTREFGVVVLWNKHIRWAKDRGSASTKYNADYLGSFADLARGVITLNMMEILIEIQRRTNQDGCERSRK